MSTTTSAPTHRRPCRVGVGRAEVLLHRVLSDAESASATRALLDPSPSLREQCWHVGPGGLVTIGAPLYCNRHRFQLYTERARATNGLMYETYRWLYDRVADLFEGRYACPVSFVEELAIPGFHLIAYGRAGRFEGGGWHFDQLAQQVPYFAKRATETEGILNFTLPLAVPSGGTGMDIVDETAGNPTEVRLPYRPGVILFNECELRHRIAASICREDGECRLTLQGHGVRIHGRLLLFW